MLGQEGIAPAHRYRFGESLLKGDDFSGRFRANLGPITAELRRELYDVPFESIDFAAHRHDLAETDLHVRPGAGLRLAYDALALYESRARAVDPTHRVGAATEAIITRLDALPLAIELAAARAHVVSPARMLEQLDRPLEVLRATHRDATEMHSSLRRAIDA